MDADQLARVAAAIDRDAETETGMTPAPWRENGYNALYAPALMQPHRDFEARHEAAGEPVDERGNYPEPWRTEEYDLDPRVLSVPPIAGDTATRRHRADLEGVEQLRNRWPLYLALARAVVVQKIMGAVWAGIPDSELEDNLDKLEAYRAATRDIGAALAALAPDTEEMTK